MNTIAPLMVISELIDNVLNSSLKSVAIITSKMGSLEDNSSGGAYFYRSSKTAVNSYMKSISIDLEKKGIKAVVVHPGWVKTDMGGSNARIDVNTSATGIKKVLLNLKPKDNGTFFNYDGSTIPW